MDNASKALIIAAGVLIAIAIISISLYMFNAAQGVAKVSNDKMESTAIEAFNRFYQSFGSSGSIISGIDALNISSKVKDDHWRHSVKRTLSHDISCSGKESYLASLTEPDGEAKMKQTVKYYYSDSDYDGYIDTISFQ